MTACPTCAHIFPLPIFNSPLTTNSILALEKSPISTSTGFDLLFSTSGLMKNSDRSASGP